MNNGELISGCLEHLASGNHTNFAVFVTENAGQAAFLETCERLAKCPHLRAVAPPSGPFAEFALQPGQQRVVIFDPGRNLGYAGGTNAAISQTKISKWDAIWVLNADTFPEKDALAALVARQAEGNYGMVGSRLILVSSGLVQTWGGIAWRPWIGRGKLLGLHHPASEHPDIASVERATAFVSGASMYVTRDYVEQVGGMDEDFFMFFEDTEWCLRGHDRYRFGYAHESVVHHIHGGSAGSSQVRKRKSRLNLYLMERNKVLLARKRLAAGALVAILIYLASLPEHLLRDRSATNFFYAFQGWWAGVCGEKGPPKWLGR